MHAPVWLQVLSWVSLAAAACCALGVAADILRGARQPMWIMNLVWPLTALYAGPLGLWFYLRHRQPPGHSVGHRQQPSRNGRAWEDIALATTHCGAGCTLGDVIAENLTRLAPLRLFGEALFGTWLVDYAAALAFGIAFQYFSIKPMQDLAPAAALRKAAQADWASLSAWQLGMYGWMALTLFVLLPGLPKGGAVFWFMMQLAMVAGFATSYPVNRWLLGRGIKHAM